MAVERIPHGLRYLPFGELSRRGSTRLTDGTYNHENVIRALPRGRNSRRIRKVLAQPANVIVAGFASGMQERGLSRSGPRKLNDDEFPARSAGER